MTLVRWLIMKIVKNKKTKFSRTIILLSVLLISSLVTTYAQKNSKSTPLFVSALTPHSAISITDDSGFSSFPGTGTVVDPYVIEGYNITTTSDKGIYIASTTKYFVIHNCYVDANLVGIHIDSIADGTATILNNTCTSNNNFGIQLSSSDNNSVSANTCTNNYKGIQLSSSDNNSVSANTCTNNIDYGISLDFSTNNSVSANTCTNNTYGGIRLYSSSYNSVSANTCTNNTYGIRLGASTTNNSLISNTCSYNSHYGILLGSSGSTNNSLISNTCSYNTQAGIGLLSSSDNSVSANNCSNNTIYGIFLSQSSYTFITDNFLHDNGAYSVRISILSFTNLIYGNIFDNNNFGGPSQAYDDGVDNQWFDQLSSSGNYWSDWDGSTTYSIDGSSTSFDPYPSEYPQTPPRIENVTHSPFPPTNSSAITISATITDSSGIDSVMLHYRINAGGWVVVSMTLSTGSTYQVPIGPFTVDTVISYYITATDNCPEHNEATEDNNGLYYSFTVSSPVVPEFQTLSLLFFSFSILFSFVVVLIVQKRRKE